MELGGVKWDVVGAVVSLGLQLRWRWQRLLRSLIWIGALRGHAPASAHHHCSRVQKLQAMHAETSELMKLHEDRPSVALYGRRLYGRRSCCNHHHSPRTVPVQSPDQSPTQSPTQSPMEVYSVSKQFSFFLRLKKEFVSFSIFKPRNH